MSKRKVTDPVTKFTYDLVRTPNPLTGISRDPDSQKYFKENYIDAVKIITPDTYFEEDRALSGNEVPATSQLINSHILAANSSDILEVSAIAHLDELSSMNNISGLSKYFVKQNNLTWIAPQDFERDILSKLGKTFSDFDSSADFLTYLSGTFLPTIVCVKNTDFNLAESTDSAFDNTSSGTHKYLIEKLSWMYFLNTSDPTAGGALRPSGYATSSEVALLMTQKLWNGDVIGLADGLRVFEKYLWSNYPSFSSINEEVIPKKYRLSGTDEWLSGTQHRERLETLVDVVYAGDYFNDLDDKVDEAFQDYMNVTSLLTEEDPAGPFTRALNAFAFSFADRMGEATEIETLVDIDSCPDDFLPYLADLIGWTLIGPDSTRHRNQLRQAVAVYKAKGTKRSVQAMVDTVFGSPSAFNVTSGSLFDLWESYVPNLIFYTIATSSTLTEKGLESFTQAKADSLGLDRYSQTDLETNVRLAVDRIIWELANEFPNNFIFANKIFPRVKFFFENDPEEQYTGPWMRDEDGNYYAGEEISPTTRQIVPTQDPNFVFSYRSRTMPIPPWEEIKYYSQCGISLALLDAIKRKLICFGVSEESATSVYNYIRENTLDNVNIDFYRNSFLFFSVMENLPFNYREILNVSRVMGNELPKYLPYWSSKSSHFKIVLQASSFNFTSIALNKESKYALSRIKTLVNTVAPAHAIPDIILNVSAVEDGMGANLNLSAIAAPKAILDLSSVAASGSKANILTNYAVSAVNPATRLPQFLWNKFRRADADSLNDSLFASNVADVFFSAAPRNALRRKNYKYLMEGENIDLRDGKGSAGYDWLYRAIQLPSFYSGGASLQNSGVFSLGFIPSSLSFVPVALTRDANNFGNLIDRVHINGVWHSCQEYNSSDIFFEIETSNTFPLRGLSGVNSSSTASFFGKRGSLSELQALQHRIKEESLLYEASSIVSGYLNPDGATNSGWAVSSSRIRPSYFSQWYRHYQNVPTTEQQTRSIARSMSNQLHESVSGVDNLNYMRDFAFGETLHRFYREWMDNYSRVPINFNFKYFTADNIISHTYGPYVFNSDFEITASSIDDVAPSLVASTVGSIIDIGYNYGKGVLSPSNVFGVTNFEASNATDMFVYWPEVRNDTLLSGLEFVDTSNPYAPAGVGGAPGGILKVHRPPTFALLRLAKLSKNLLNTVGLPLWQKISVLEDNLVIRYGRNGANVLPRLRYKIEPDSDRPDIKNFLVPNSEYQIDIKAANIRGDGLRIGGNTLKVWIHTEPLSFSYTDVNGSSITEDSVWSFFGGGWVRNRLGDRVSTTLGGADPNATSVVGDFQWQNLIANSMSQKFTEKSIQLINRERSSEIGNTRALTTNEIITPYDDLSPRIGCDEDTIDPTESQTIWASEDVFETLSFNFNTNNKAVDAKVSTMQDGRMTSQLHIKNRKYYIEIFVAEADDHSFVLFDTIEMHNKSFREKASIPSTYHNYELNKKELKAVFDYFTSLANSRLATRNQISSSGSMELSGGSRLNYRDNIKRQIHEGPTAPFFQLSSLVIRGE